jgi:hypothetical protein
MYNETVLEKDRLIKEFTILSILILSIAGEYYPFPLRRAI